jgi:hypothetical protein
MDLSNTYVQFKCQGCRLKQPDIVYDFDLKIVAIFLTLLLFS